MGAGYEVVVTSSDTISAYSKAYGLKARNGPAVFYVSQILLLLIHSARVQPENGILWSPIPLWGSAVLLQLEKQKQKKMGHFLRRNCCSRGIDLLR